MDLLLLLGPILIQGGKGGRAGVNGSGGAGGMGGMGGASYTWTTTSHHTTYDGQGRSHTTTQTHWHTNPGGFPGPPGIPGRNGSAVTTKGKDGSDGNYKFIIESKGKEKQVYKEKYDIQMTKFQTKFPDSNEIYEPGYQPHVSQITLHNAGGMPTPIHQDLWVSIVDTDTLKQVDELTIPRKLAAGETRVINLVLHFFIRYPQPHVGFEPYKATGYPQL